MAEPPIPTPSDRAAKVGVIVRFVPDGLSWRTDAQGQGRWRLRGVLALLPDPRAGAGGTIELHRWPEAIDELLAASGHKASIHLGTPIPADLADRQPKGHPRIEADILHHSAGRRRDPSRSTAAGRLWRALLDPGLDVAQQDTLHPEIRYVAQVARAGGPFPDAWASLHRPWSALRKAIADSLGPDTRVALAGDGPRVSATPAADLHDLAAGVSAVRLLSGLTRSTFSQRRRRDVEATVELPVQAFARRLTRTLGLSAMFEERGAGAAQVTRASLSSGDGQASRSGSDAYTATINGLLEARRKPPPPTTTAHAAGEDADAFGRDPPPRRDAPPLPAGVVSAVENALHAAEASSSTTRKGLKQETDRFAALSRRRIDQLGGLLGKWREDNVWLARTGAPRQDTFIDHLAATLGDRSRAAAPPSSTAIAAIAAHLCATRPDAPLAPGSDRGLAARADAPRPSDEDLHRAALELADAPNRRFFGLFAYPALARALNLVLDVEFDLDPQVLADRTPTAPIQDGSTVFAAIAATFDPAALPEIWSACKLAGAAANDDVGSQRFVATGKEEIALALAAAMARTEAPAPEPPGRDGVLNLGASFDGRPRFRLASLDVVSHAEQLIGKSKADANAEASGRPLDEVDGHAPDRTAGVALIDASRTLEVEKQLDGAKGHAARLDRTATGPLIMYGEDLTIGYRVDVGVVARAGPMRGRTAWRSLMGRTVRFGRAPAPGGSVDVERLVGDALRASAPVRHPRAHAEAAVRDFRNRLDEASVRGASRLAVSKPQQIGEHPSDADIIAQQTLALWAGDPLGAPCTPDDKGSEVDPARDLGLSVTIGLAGHDAPPGLLPPRLEIDRTLVFGARQALIGGAGSAVEEAALVYDSKDGGALVQPPRGAAPFRFHRHERVAKPNLAALHRPFSPLHDPRGDTLDTLIVRSGDLRRSTPRTHRIIYAPATPQAFTALHPDGPVNGGRHRVLDDLPVLGGRPVGGMPHVLLDPLTGGLPVRSGSRIRFATRYGPNNPVKRPKAGQKPEEGVFCLRANDIVDLASRRAPYYPDPAVDGLVVELWTRGASARPLGGAGSRVFIPLYDRAYRQSLPYGLLGELTSTRCVYPFAMPVLVEVETRDGPLPAGEPRVGFEPGRDTGFMMAVGGFTPYVAGLPPPPGSTTMRRVRIALAPGEDFDVKVWATVPADRQPWFAAVDHAVTLLVSAGGSPESDGPTTQEARSTALDRGARAVLGVDLTRQGKPGRNALVRFHGHLADTLAASPMPDRAEVTTFRVVHAAQRPPAPAFRGVGAPTGLELVRRSFKSDEAFAAWATGTGPGDGSGAWTTLSEQAGTTTWFKGIMGLDLRRADTLSVEASYLDVADDPSRPLRLKDGQLYWDRANIILLDRKLPDDPYAASDDSLDLLRSNTGLVRALSHKFNDSHARHLTLTPVATSRFAGLFMRPDRREPDRLFRTKGKPISLWLPSTRRPASLEQVEILPAFAWTSRSGSAARTTWLRLQWRRRPPAVAPVADSPEAASNLWFSTGEGERLAVLFDALAGGATTPADAAAVGVDVETDALFKSYWARDPIRRGRAPLKQFIRRMDVQANELPKAPEPPRWEEDVRMPLPGGEDQDAPTQTRYGQRHALTFAPTYVPDEDLWRVDLQLDTRDLAGPWLQLALARFQPNALVDPARDLRLSEPLMVECPMTPFREVTVVAGKRLKDEQLWPIEIVVRGPLGVVNGGAEDQTDPVLKDRMRQVSRPRFTAQVLEGYSQGRYKRNGRLGGENILESADSDAAPPPVGDELWRTVIHVPVNPRRYDLYVFVREVDLMLPADPDPAGPGLVESGTRFSAKVRVA